MIVGLMAARNESWCIGLTLRAALLWCDKVVTLDHRSADDTAKIIAEVADEHPSRVQQLRVEGEWNESEHRQMMLDEGRLMGGTHFAIIDADELLTANLLPTIRQTIESMPPRTMYRLPWICPWKAIDNWRTDNLWGGAYAFCVFSDSPGVHWTKTERRFHTRYPQGVGIRQHGRHIDGGLIHLQFADWRRVTAKHKLYRMLEILHHPGRTVKDINAQYDRSLDEDGLTASPMPEGWIAPYQKWMHRLDLNQTPWHEAEIERLVEDYGRDAFKGLI